MPTKKASAPKKPAAKRAVAKAKPVKTVSKAAVVPKPMPRPAVVKVPQATRAVAAPRTDIFVEANALLRTAPRRQSPQASSVRPTKARMVRGSEILVWLCLTMTVIVLAATFAAAGYYMSTAEVSLDDVPLASPNGESAYAAAGATPAPTVPAEVPDPIPFLVVPGTLTDGIVRAPGGIELSVVGNAPGADEAELLFSETGPGASGAEQVVGRAAVGDDGSFDLKVTFASGTIGRILVRAYVNGTPISNSASKGIITE